MSQGQPKATTQVAMRFSDKDTRDRMANQNGVGVPIQSGVGVPIVNQFESEAGRNTNIRFTNYEPKPIAFEQTQVQPRIPTKGISFVIFENSQMIKDLKQLREISDSRGSHSIVGPKQQIEHYIEQFKGVNQGQLLAKFQASYVEEYPSIRGGGNCFYTAFGVLLLEYSLNHGNGLQYLLDLIAETILHPIRLQQTMELVSTNEDQKNLRNYLLFQISKFQQQLPNVELSYLFRSQPDTYFYEAYIIFIRSLVLNKLCQQADTPNDELSHMVANANLNLIMLWEEESLDSNEKQGLEDLKRFTKQPKQKQAIERQPNLFYKKLVHQLMGFSLMVIAYTLLVKHIPQKCQHYFSENSQFCDFPVTCLMILNIMGLFRAFYYLTSFTIERKQYYFYSNMLFTRINRKNYHHYLSFLLYLSVFAGNYSMCSYIDMHFSYELQVVINLGITATALIVAQISFIHLIYEFQLICSNQRGECLDENQRITAKQFQVKLLTLKWIELVKRLQIYSQKQYDMDFKVLLLLP